MAMHLIIHVFIPRTDECFETITGSEQRVESKSIHITGYMEAGRDRSKNEMGSCGPVSKEGEMRAFVGHLIHHTRLGLQNMTVLSEANTGDLDRMSVVWMSANSLVSVQSPCCSRQMIQMIVRRSRWSEYRSKY